MKKSTTTNKRTKIRSNSLNHLDELRLDDTSHQKGVKMLECISPNYIRQSPSGAIKMVSRNVYLLNVNEQKYYKYYEIRCRHCLACKLLQCYQKASRLMIESVNREYSYFITLTFDDENYRFEELLSNPLREGQLFIKRLRKRFTGVKIKYFLTSELGTQNKRFHYHAIIFTDIGIFEDMYKIGETKEDRPLFTSHILKELWGKGRVSVDYACLDSLKYVANYVQDSIGSVKHSFSKGIGDDYLHKYIEANGTRAIISGNNYNLTRTQLDKLGVEKEEFTVNPNLNMSIEDRKRNAKELQRRFYRK